MFSNLVLSRSVMSSSLWPHGLYTLPGFSVRGILQARILEWVAMPSSRGSSQPRDWIYHCRRILYQLSHQGSPRILELGGCVWVCVWLLLLLSHSGVSVCDSMCYQAKLDLGCRGEVCVCQLLSQGIFLTQVLNWGLLHCRQILYQLSYQGSPFRQNSIPWIVLNI